MFSVVICGPLECLTSDSTEYFLSQNIEVIVSVWEPKNADQEKYLEDIRKLNPHKLLVHPFINVEDYDNQQNIYYHGYLWLKGVQETSGQYVVKSRSSCVFRNWSKIATTMINNPKKIATSSIFFRNGFFYPFFYCPSDFLVVCERNLMLNSLNILLEDLKDKNYYDEKVPAETKICESFLKSLGIKKSFDQEEAKNIMTQTYTILNVNDLDCEMLWGRWKIRPYIFRKIDHKVYKSISNIEYYQTNRF